MRSINCWNSLLPLRICRIFKNSVFHRRSVAVAHRNAAPPTLYMKLKRSKTELIMPQKSPFTKCVGSDELYNGSSVNRVSASFCPKGAK